MLYALATMLVIQYGLCGYTIDCNSNVELTTSLLLEYLWASVDGVMLIASDNFRFVKF